MGFVKLHDQIFHSSIIEEDLTTRWVWICLLLSCDRNGNIYGTPAALARRANVEQKEFLEALERLMAPDPNSSTPDHDGRRIIETGPNLYHCVNYAYYRGLRDPEEQREQWRERKARQRAREKEETEPAATEEPTKPAAKARRFTREECALVVGRYNLAIEGTTLPEVTSITDRRLSATAARVKEHGMEKVVQAFDEIKKSAFLQGNGGRDSWTGATFDWIMRPNNFVKVIEGAYRDKPGGRPGTGPPSGRTPEQERRFQQDKEAYERAANRPVAKRGEEVQ